MTVPRLTGDNQVGLRFTSEHGTRASVSVAYGAVFIDGVKFDSKVLHFLADLAEGTDRHGYPTTHTMSECFWVDCPLHKCEYTHSHTRAWCGRPTCRES